MDPSQEQPRVATPGTGSADPVAPLGSWSHDLKTGAVSWAAGTEELFGLPAGACADTPDAFLCLIQAEDRGLFARTTEAATAHGGRHELEFRTVWPDGSV